MAKEWILNSATNRFQLNFKRNVGAVSEQIRLCQPKSIGEWEKYYYNNVYPESHLVELGKKLYIKITEVISSEVDEVTEQDCIEYIKQLIINRTYDGYTTEIKTIYGQLQSLLNWKIESASDKWDRLYNVDFFIKINNKFIGLQIKPVSHTSHIPELFKERSLQLETHSKFEKEFGGKVFYIYSIKDGSNKRITNIEVVNEIKNEIERLTK